MIRPDSLTPLVRRKEEVEGEKKIKENRRGIGRWSTGTKTEGEHQIFVKGK
jgi:hypothetical protein